MTWSSGRINNPAPHIWRFIKLEKLVRCRGLDIQCHCDFNIGYEYVVGAFTITKQVYPLKHKWLLKDIK
jgi:hypothetical protein